MHYANCNTYNADFDGDEMNIHFPQVTKKAPIAIFDLAMLTLFILSSTTE